MRNRPDSRSRVAGGDPEGGVTLPASGEALAGELHTRRLSRWSFFAVGVHDLDRWPAVEQLTFLTVRFAHVERNWLATRGVGRKNMRARRLGSLHCLHREGLSVRLNRPSLLKPFLLVSSVLCTPTAHLLTFASCSLRTRSALYAAQRRPSIIDRPANASALHLTSQNPSDRRSANEAQHSAARSRLLGDKGSSQSYTETAAASGKFT